MPANKRTPWLICYDIADPARLREVHKEVRRFATPLQYSVFRTSATKREVASRLSVLEQIIDPRCDDVRAYPLLSASAPVVYGRGLLARGIHFAWSPRLFDNPHEDAPDSEVDHEALCTNAQGLLQRIETALEFHTGLSERSP